MSKRKRSSQSQAAIQAALGIALEQSQHLHVSNDDEDDDSPFQELLTGSETQENLSDRVKARDEERETQRSNKYRHAQRVIQHQYEKHGLSEIFFGWLHRYLVFLAVRKVSESDGRFSEVSIHDATQGLCLLDPNLADVVQDTWLKMTAPDTGTIRKFESRIGADGKPIPIYHWINRTFAREMLSAELARARSKEYQGYDDRDRGDYDDEAGDRPDPNYARVDEWSASATLGNWFEPEESTFGRTEYEKEVLSFIRSGWAHEGNKGKTPFRSALTRVMISTLILEMGGKPNGAEITRRLNAGNYPLPYGLYPKLRDAVPEPYPVPIDERKVQRLIEDYVDGLRKINEKHERLALEERNGGAKL